MGNMALYGGGAGMGLLAAYTAYKWYSNNTGDEAQPQQHVKLDDIAEVLQPYFTLLENEFYEVLGKDGAHLSVSFFEKMVEIIYLKTNETIQTIRAEQSPFIIGFYKQFRFVDYAKLASILAQEICHEEMKAIKEISEFFNRKGNNDPDLIYASRVFHIRNNPKPFFKMLLKGPKCKHIKRLDCPEYRQPSEEEVRKVCLYMRDKLRRRKETGFEGLDGKNFPYIFEVELAFEIQSKYDVVFEDFWSTGCLSKYSQESQKLWKECFSEYCGMLKDFYHSIPQFAPGLRL